MVWNRLATPPRLLAMLLVTTISGTGLYGAYRAKVSADAACQGLRHAILQTLEKDVDVRLKRALVYSDLASFEQRCAFSDPGAAEVFAAVDRTILFASDTVGGAPPRPVRFAPPPPGAGNHPSGGHGLAFPPPFSHQPERPFGT